LTDYQAQANRPFEHEAHLKELLARKAQLNGAPDLDKRPKPCLRRSSLSLRTPSRWFGHERQRPHRDQS
jgi:hypothetical protein